MRAGLVIDRLCIVRVEREHAVDDLHTILLCRDPFSNQDTSHMLEGMGMLRGDRGRVTTFTSADECEDRTGIPLDMRTCCYPVTLKSSVQLCCTSRRKVFDGPCRVLRVAASIGEYPQ